MARRRSENDQHEPEIERLYALPPAAFTAARDELSGRLRREGRRDAAVTIKALPRPTPSSWVVSRLMRLEPARFQALLAAGRRARQAQGRVVGGGAASAGAAAAQLREALATARQAIEELRRRGLELLAAAGTPATARTADRLAADLQALAFTAGAESAIARGWLDHDLEAPGFEVLAGLQAAAGRARAATPRPAADPPPPPAAAAGTELGRRAAGRPETDRREPRAPGRPSAAQQGREKEAVRRRQLEAERREERTRREQARLREARERDRERLARAEAEVERAAGESAQKRVAAMAAERAAAEARRRADDAQREAERAQREAERASQVLDGAEARLAAARAAADRADHPYRDGIMASGAEPPPEDETR